MTSQPPPPRDDDPDATRIDGPREPGEPDWDDEEATRVNEPREPDWDDEAPRRPPTDEPTRVVRAGDPVPPPGPASERREVVEERVPARRRRDPLWPWLLLLVLLVLGGLAALFLLGRDDEDEATVPQVTGLTVDEAVARVEAEGLEAVVRRQASDRPRGRVFGQRPGPGSKLDEGEEVTLLVSRGPREVDVPNVVGLPLERARERLEDAELEANEVPVPSEEPPGTVVAQDPKAGDRVRAGSRVRVNVSEERVEAPDVLGRTADEAGSILRRAGLEVNAVDVPGTEPEGTVVAQAPRAGEEVAKGSRVRINVSTGAGATGGTTTGAAPGGTTTGAAPGGTTTGTTGSPPPTLPVPDVVGLTEGEARAELRRAGFRIRVEEDFAADPVDAGLVVRQRPRAGQRARRGAEIVIVVGAGA